MRKISAGHPSIMTALFLPGFTAPVLRLFPLGLVGQAAEVLLDHFAVMGRELTADLSARFLTLLGWQIAPAAFVADVASW